MTTYFNLSGISELPSLHIPIFLLVLVIYLVTLGGNMTIFLLVCLVHQLHTPMYFLLSNLSIIDLFCSTITLHKVLLTFMTGDNSVPVVSCLVQIFIFLSLLCNELLILAAMSYDRYVAICNPLHYHMIMNLKVCALMVVACWAWSFIETFPIFMQLLKITCYRSNRVNHFFCDVVPLKKLSCSDTFILELYILIVGILVAAFTPFVLTFLSYVFIIRTVIRMRSNVDRHKAFYTCLSHLTVVVLLYSTLVFQYLRPSSGVNLDSSKFSSLFNTAAVPILNPLIYSLKNKEVKAALRRRILAWP
ncbi:olfactory receptor 6C1-like [Leptodactylus fuscus]